MDFITRDQFDQFVRDSEEIKVEDLIFILEEKLGYSVFIEKKPHLTSEQKKHMTDHIFSNEAIIKQLDKASKEQNYIIDDNKALEIIREARDGK
ncbi:hypothetical protein CIL05_18885 [Virgibacillus profundi]|uniref:Uncharacterized protein n=1 Tax=Virgibacillus profundi TaxID=2024555 RepID=A0A2A2I9Z3_9BACI|nr:hypothetical protein [Virgibacillus profundi]PAV27940.1 hypothetical protein CIL05_18885 [Virgibacillus profundi]PXY52118.1 hypothetical protein CIT14_18980 [Virgibacillus profundi]